MAIIKDNIAFLLPAIALLAFCSLISTQPSRSGIFLFCQALVIDIYLAFTYGPTSPIFGTSVLLSFFAMIVVGSNLYFELSFKKVITKPPKLNIVVGIAVFILFWQYAFDQFSASTSTESYSLNLNYDGLSLTIAGFSLFAILVAALIIFDHKHPKSGDQT